MRTGTPPSEIIDAVSSDHSIYSSTREKIVEHIFVGESLRLLWSKGVRDVEVLWADVDSAGYDLIMECNGIMRHIQLKSSKSDPRNQRIAINAKLCRKPSGCVILIRLNEANMSLGPFYWFGAAPGEPCAEVNSFEQARRTTRNKQGERALAAEQLCDSQIAIRSP